MTLMNQTDVPRTFIIPSTNLARFDAKLTKLAKRASKLGCEVPSYRIVSEEQKTIQIVTGTYQDDLGRDKELVEERVILLNHIVISNPQVIVEGHEFVASIEHTSDDGNFIHTVPGFEGKIPLKYRTAPAGCDHCKLIRRRRDTFIVRKIQDNTFLEIGRQCLGDYLGRDAERFAAIAELYSELSEIAEASEGGGSYGSREATFDLLDQYLAYVSETIFRYGWKSRGVAKEYGGAATVDIALRHMHPSPYDIQNNLLEWRVPTDKSIEDAKLAIQWAESIQDSEAEESDYLYNIRLIARRGIVSLRQAGYAASIVSSYQKHIGELKRKARFADQALVSTHVGTVGERRTFDLLVEKVIASEGAYGVSYIHLMSDKAGNRFVWFSSSGKLEENKEVCLKGSVKKHDFREGIKQTILSRCEEIQMKTYACTLAGATYTGKAESEKEYRKELLKVLNLNRLPKGSIIQQLQEEPVGSLSTF